MDHESVQRIKKSCELVEPARTAPFVDFFERIPDPLVLLIFDKVADAKALARCCVVSKRFSHLVFSVESVVVKVDCVLSGNDRKFRERGKGMASSFLTFLIEFCIKSFQALYRRLRHKIAVPVKLSDNSPCKVLKRFKDVQHLRIELPGGELGFEDGVLLKWKAEFGSSLESCVLFGASSFEYIDQSCAAEWLEGVSSSTGNVVEQDPQAIRSQQNTQVIRSEERERAAVDDEGATIPESFYSEGGLKLRVVWTITSLVAASARHYFLQKIIPDHPTLVSLVLTDAAGQGTLCMNKQQLQDFRDNPLEPSASSSRTQIPALSMKLWYAPYLELPDGALIKGATLVAIKPSDESRCSPSEDFLTGAFEEPFRTAASILAKRRTYILEMNSF